MRASALGWNRRCCDSNASVRATRCRLTCVCESLLRAVEQAMLNPDVFHTITAPARNELEARQ